MGVNEPFRTHFGLDDVPETFVEGAAPSLRHMAFFDAVLVGPEHLPFARGDEPTTAAVVGVEVDVG